MATVERLLPRHWDGRRLLQFLTGLALIALAFALPALLTSGGPAAGAPLTVITTVDSPALDGPPLIEAPAGSTAQADDRTRPPAAAGSGTVGALGSAGITVVLRHDGRRICDEAAVAGDSATRRAHGERGPPRV